MSRNCLPQCQQVQARSQDLWNGVSHQLVWSVIVQPADVWCWLETSTQRILQCGTQVDLSATFASSIPASIPVLRMAELVSTVPSSSEIRAAQNHAQVVVPEPSGGIPLHNSFEALRRNDEDDVPIDGHEVFFGDESDTESLPGLLDWRLWTELICPRSSINVHTR